jgi:hypothetical protein
MFHDTYAETIRLERTQRFVSGVKPDPKARRCSQAPSSLDAPLCSCPVLVSIEDLGLRPLFLCFMLHYCFLLLFCFLPIFIEELNPKEASNLLATGRLPPPSTHS